MTVAEEIERLVAREQHDPHGVLGAHASRGGVVVRAYRPGADRVAVVPADGKPVRLRRVHPDGVFAGRVAGASLPLEYECATRSSVEVTIVNDKPRADRSTMINIATIRAMPRSDRAAGFGQPATGWFMGSLFSVPGSGFLV